MNLEITEKGASAASQHLAEIASRALNPEPAFNTIADRLMDAERRLFDSGRGWKPDKPATLKRKARKGQDPRPLHATGAGMRALTVRGAPGQKLIITRDEMTFGIAGGKSAAFYMRFQKARGRDPLVSRDVVTRWASRELATFLTRA